MGLGGKFFDLPAEVMSALGTVLGFALLGGLNYNQQNSLGSWLELIGQVLESNAAQGQLLQAQAQGDRLDALEAQMERLRQELEGLRRAQGSTEPTVAADSGGEEKTT